LAATCWDKKQNIIGNELKKTDPPKSKNPDLNRLTKEEYCYLTTVGRVTGKPHEIEIWFGLIKYTLYMLSGGGEESDWVKNMRHDPSVNVRIRKEHMKGQARFVSQGEEDQMARRLLAGKYQGWREGRRLSEWARTALTVAVDLESSVVR
jgi:deazaflavin-dependent oxidoreductase (nitroreductase family)